MQEGFFSQGLFVLTGASSGMGLAVAENLAAKGAELIIASRSIEKLEAQKRNLEQRGARRVDLVALDMSQPDAASHVIKSLGQRKIRGLLLNAGGPKSGPIASLAYSDFVSANQLLVAGPAQFLISLIPHLEPQRSSVVAITSTSVKEPVRELNLSAIYRSAFVVLLKNLATELGPKGIRLNNVGPGKISTDHLEHLIEANAKKNNVSLAAEKASWEECSVLNRMGTPEEVANVIVFLMSPEASFVNGQTILVDGSSTKSYF